RTRLPALFTDIRLEPLPGGYSRLTFLLDKPATIRSAFLIPASGSTSARLVIDAVPATQSAFERQLDRVHGTLAIPEAATDAKTLPFAGPGGTRLDAISKPAAPAAPIAPAAPDILPLIVIDAGHGGIDSGAVGSNVQEKDVTLAVA